jgi:anti-sigma-K factor RskA
MSPDANPIDPEGCAANAAPYVLGALTAPESEAYRRHIDSCAICREEVAALQVVAAALPAAAPQLTAPSSLKERVMSQVRADARARAPETSREPARGAPRRWTLGWLGGRPALAGVALAVVVVVALVVVALVPGGSGSLQTRVVRAEVLVPRATAQLRVGGGRAELKIENLPQSSPGRVYEVWLKGSGRPQPTDALFTVAANGEATVGVPGVGRAIKVVMVTSEPLGGSRVPTGAPLIIARLS